MIGKDNGVFTGTGRAPPSAHSHRQVASFQSGVTLPSRVHDVERNIGREGPGGARFGNGNKDCSPLSDSVHETTGRGVRGLGGWANYEEIHPVEEISGRLNPRASRSRNKEDSSQVQTEIGDSDDAGVVHPHNPHPVPLGTGVTQDA